MIPILNGNDNIDHVYQQYIIALGGKFKGDIHHDYSSRITSSTDNSIYQVVPEIVVFPKDKQDIIHLFKTASSDKFKNINFSPRGGGTGTNGQSLSSGIIIDSSRYMNKIIEVDIKNSTAIVEPAVVLDQLNDKLAPHKVFFAPNLSPSNRATIGGMVSTDACGKGSRIYGRTSQHILALECILVNGTSFTTKELSASELQTILQRNQDNDTETNIYANVTNNIHKYAKLIDLQFPKLDRFMTGYNLAKTCDLPKQTTNLNYLIAGSEGTLVFISSIKLKLTPIPKQKALFAIQYPSFNQALRDAKKLLSYKPAAIETIDDNILKLAKDDEIYIKVGHMLASDSKVQPEALNLVEFIADDTTSLMQQINELKNELENLTKTKVIASFYLAFNTKEINSLWELRKKGVGLLGKMVGDRKPIPFMEDTAVPPEHLAGYILELRTLLDNYGLKYGMFGHVDVGCLHMRPVLDMNKQEDSKLVNILTKEINDLVKKYGGVYWSEHGKGFRSEYVEDYFGEKLYQVLRKIKTSFDPYNQLNPGKIATSFNSTAELVKVDGPFRGYQDAQIHKVIRDQYAGAFNCNGNAECLNYHPNMLICPSAKVSRNWVYSPKGRTALIREWLRQLAKEDYLKLSNYKDKSSLKLTVQKFFQHYKMAKDTKNDFSHQVYNSLAKCLGCKACASLCPIKVDIPNMKPIFLSHYHSRYPRPIRDYIFANNEKIAQIQSYLPQLTNKIMNANITKKLINKSLKIRDMPSLSKQNLSQYLKTKANIKFSWQYLQNLTANQKKKTVCLVQDSLTSFYNANISIATYEILTKLGFQVIVLPFKENGKALHSKGFFKKFKNIANQNALFYNKIAKLNIPLIGIEPSLVLCYQDEYPKIIGKNMNFKIELIQEWLVTQLTKLPSINSLTLSNKEINNKISYQLFSHCTEKSLTNNGADNWKNIFKHFSLKLELMETGCCGMAGSFGHELENFNDSKKIYQLSWQKYFTKLESTQIALVTGYSCRCQVKRLSNQQTYHPIEVLNNLISNAIV